MDGLCTLNYAMVEIHAPKTVPRFVSYATIPEIGCISRRRFMFHAVYLRKKIYSTENNRITIGYKMLLFRGLVLLTAVNIEPRFRLVNRTVSSREPHRPSRVLPLRFTRANVHMDSGGTVV